MKNVICFALLTLSLNAFAAGATSDGLSTYWQRTPEAAQQQQAKQMLPEKEADNLVVDRIIDPPLAMKHEVRLFIDERTGCHYLVAGGLFQPTTLMARRYSDGVQVCD